MLVANGVKGKLIGPNKGRAEVGSTIQISVPHPLVVL
jgi:hypothetical protein